MKIGILLPTLLMAPRYSDRIFALKDLCMSLTNGLVDRGHTVYLYTASGVKTKAHLVPGDPTLEEKSFSSKKDFAVNPESLHQYADLRSFEEYEIELTQKALAHAKELQLDIVHVYRTLLSSYLLDLSPVPFIHTLHDPVPEAETLENLRIKNLSHHNYVTLSRSMFDSYKKALDITITATVPHGLSTKEYIFEPQSENECLISMGRYLPEKGMDVAIQVAQHTGKILKIASSKNYQHVNYYEEKIKPFLDGEKISEIGYFTSTVDKSVFLGKGKVFLFPISWEEPFGMVMLEAMATGTPVIAYARGSTPEVIKDGETGFLVNSSDEDKRGDFVIKKVGIEGLKEAVERIWAMSPEAYLKMRHACRIHVEQNFTVEKMAENYEKVYQEILAKPAA